MERAWIFGRLGVTVARVDFLDPALASEADARERGVRVEVRTVTDLRAGSIYASPTRHLQPAVCRIDLLESAAGAADRMHWHPVMGSGEPGDRSFEVGMSDDPLTWLGEQLGQVDLLLARAGVSSDDQVQVDVEAIRDVVPEIVAEAERGLQWARVDPWPTVVRDDRGLAVT